MRRFLKALRAWKYIDFEPYDNKMLVQYYECYEWSPKKRHFFMFDLAQKSRNVLYRSSIISL